MLGIWKGDTGRRGQRGTEQHQRADVVARRDHADGERQQRGPEQRGGGDYPDRGGIEAERRHIGGQNDDRETVAEAAETASEVEAKDIGRPRSSLSFVHAQILDSPSIAQSLDKNCLERESALSPMRQTRTRGIAGARPPQPRLADSQNEKAPLGGAFAFL